MALIKCPECGKEISDKAKACIHCGYPLEELKDKTEENLFSSPRKCLKCGKITANPKATVCQYCLEPLPDYNKDQNGTAMQAKRTCPRCKEVILNLNATRCPYCYAALDENGNVVNRTVRIKMPNNVVYGSASLLSSRKASVRDSYGRSLWDGMLGENASFSISRPTKITISLGGWANPVTGTVEPGKKYTLAQDYGVHLFATFILTEVDVIT